MPLKPNEGIRRAGLLAGQGVTFDHQPLQEGRGDAVLFAQGGQALFGGGAHVIDLGVRKSIGWTSSQEWLAGALNGEDVDA